MNTIETIERTQDAETVTFLHKTQTEAEAPGLAEVRKSRRGRKKKVEAEAVGKLPEKEYAELKALIEREPPELDRVMVRCNRETGQWEILHTNNPENDGHFDAAVLKNVVFETDLDPHLAVGCGSGEYVGAAIGDRLPSDVPLTVPKDLVRRIGFDSEVGCFRLKRADGRILYGVENRVKTADYLILKPGCSAEVILAPKAQPEPIQV